MPSGWIHCKRNMQPKVFLLQNFFHFLSKRFRKTLKTELFLGLPGFDYLLLYANFVTAVPKLPSNECSFPGLNFIEPKRETTVPNS